MQQGGLNDDVDVTATSTPITVKFLARGRRAAGARKWRRQLPDDAPVWDGCRFVFDPDERHYDWLVVYDDLPSAAEERFSLAAEPLACPREHTLLVTTEPSSIKVYGRAYLAQFGTVLTSQEPWAVVHPRIVHGQCGLVWFYGIGPGGVRSLDELRAAEPPTKTKTFSTVCSSKGQRHTLHRKRLQFTERLRKVMWDLDVFGHGVRPIDDKAEAIDAYRYHLAIENHVAPHHWTEKLSDPFLGYALPIYHGCPNADEYFPKDSFIAIDITRFDDAVAVIRHAIAEDAYQRRLPQIVEARRLVLERYNLFAVLAREIRRRHARADADPSAGTIFSRHALRRKSLGAQLGHLRERIAVRARQLVRRP